MPLPSSVRGVLLDIEGTTTPISFVYDVLFPYAEARLEEACARAADDPAFGRAVEALRAEHADEVRACTVGLPGFGDGAPYARYLMGRDRKSTGLKALQGLIWERGYGDGSLTGQVFDDVPAALAAWSAAGVRLRIFSSGSVLAQKLLFAHTDVGDLTGFFEGYHDTTTGPKKEPSAYAAIAAAFGLAPAEILFLSDVVAELDAAAEVGLGTGLLQRPGNPPAEPGSHLALPSFEALS